MRGDPVVASPPRPLSRRRPRTAAPCGHGLDGLGVLARTGIPSWRRPVGGGEHTGGGMGRPRSVALCADVVVAAARAFCATR